MSRTTNVVAWLSDPATHPDQPERVEVVETHISWVFLTRQFAYKLKKPVRFPFVNFESLQLRQVACENEVHLNRRLAPDVYLGTVAVSESPDGRFALAGAGQTIDWLVKMHRLDSERRCDMLLKCGDVTREQMSELADVLAGFYRRAPVQVMRSTHNGTRHDIEVLANRRDLLKAINHGAYGIVKRVHAEQLLMLNVFADRFHDRMCEGRVVDGHGDLRPEHVYFYSPPKIVDCIEFNAKYRVVDVCDDLCFFAMECAAMDRPEAGRQILNECLTAIGDAPCEELIRFYTSYRACVRAKVALCGPGRSTLDAAGSTEKALHYLHLAEANAPLGGPPWVLIVCGGIGTGKSTLADWLAGYLGFEHLQTDAVRRELHGMAGHGAGFGEGIYTPANRLHVYQEMFQRAARSLDEKVPVVLDGSFQLRAAWQAFERLLPHIEARVLIIECRCPADTARRRIEKRLAQESTQSDARPEMVGDLSAAAITIPENLARVVVDTSNPASELGEYVIRRMRSMYQGRER